MSRRTVISPKIAVGMRTGLLKVYNAALSAGIDTTLAGCEVTVEAAVSEVTGRSPDDGG